MCAWSRCLVICTGTAESVMYTLKGRKLCKYTPVHQIYFCCSLVFWNIITIIFLKQFQDIKQERVNINKSVQIEIKRSLGFLLSYFMGEQGRGNSQSQHSESCTCYVCTYRPGVLCTYYFMYTLPPTLWVGKKIKTRILKEVSKTV